MNERVRKRWVTFDGNDVGDYTKYTDTLPPLPAGYVMRNTPQSEPEPQPLSGSVLTRLCHTLQGDGQEPELWFVKIDGECAMVTDDAALAAEYYRDMGDEMPDPFCETKASVELLCRSCGSVVTAKYKRGNVYQEVHSETVYTKHVLPALSRAKK